jgi:hypothetical protein
VLPGCDAGCLEHGVDDISQVPRVPTAHHLAEPPTGERLGGLTGLRGGPAVEPPQRLPQQAALGAVGSPGRSSPGSSSIRPLPAFQGVSLYSGQSFCGRADCIVGGSDHLRYHDDRRPAIKAPTADARVESPRSTGNPSAPRHSFQGQASCVAMSTSDTCVPRRLNDDGSPNGSASTLPRV